MFKHEQKCSACSRAIVYEDVYEEVLEKVTERTKKLIIDSPAKSGTNVGPVIDEKAYRKIKEYIGGRDYLLLFTQAKLVSENM